MYKKAQFRDADDSQAISQYIEGRIRQSGVNHQLHSPQWVESTPCTYTL